jgi:sugar phosphate permease
LNAFSNWNSEACAKIFPLAKGLANMIPSEPLNLTTHDAAVLDQVSDRNAAYRMHLASAVRKARLRLTPFLALMFAISILDRSNVGFAKDALKVDAHIGDAAYALGAGIFFIGYAVFEVPSNLILHRVGAKIWLSRIMITWGIASAMMMFVRGHLSFYTLRFLVGISEAGFSPGVILYCTYWFPSRERGKALGIYYMGLPAALMLGSALSGLLMQVTNGCLSLHNWQWMFLIEGLLASMVGAIAYFYLTSRPRDATWLDANERDALEAVLLCEESQKVRHNSRHSFSALMDLRVLQFIAIYFAIQVGIYAVIFYMPSRIARLANTEINMKVGLLAAVPWLCALIGLRIITGSADRSGKHRQYAIAMLLLATLGIATSSYMPTLTSALLAFCIASTGFVVVQPLFWTLPTSYLSGALAASGIAVIGAFGNLGGFVAPTLKTAAEQLSHNQNAGTLLLAGVAGAGVLLLLNLKNDSGQSSAV